MPVDPALLVTAVGLAVLHRRGARTLAGGGAGASVRFGVGLVVVVAALSAPLETAAATSFAWHMVQHQLLTLVAAPLLASGRPLDGFLASAGRSRPASFDGGGGPGVVLLAAAVALGTLLVWHLPGLYDAALGSSLVHRLEHLSLLGTATLAWGAIVVAARDDRAGAAVVALGASAIVGAALGIVLLTAPEPLYAYGGASAALDQQLGGALMKVGALLVYAGGAVWLGSRWLARLEAAA